VLISGKYNVYKAKDGVALEALSEDSFFVLKDLDALGVMTLRSYAANALQILDWGRDPTTGLHLTEIQKEDLMLRVDGATALAEKWAKLRHKLPD
jgi:hypothetical protein